MANHYCDNKESGLDPHSIQVFSRPFLEYSKSYPSPSKQGASPEVSRAGVLFSSAPGMSRYPTYPLGIAAIQRSNEKECFSAPIEMRWLVLFADFPDRAITFPAEILAAFGIADLRPTLTSPIGALGRYPILRSPGVPLWTVASGEQRFPISEQPICP